MKEKLDFEFPEGPVAPKPEKEIEQAAKRAKRKPRAGGGSGGPRTSSPRRRGKLRGFFGGPDGGDINELVKPVVRTVHKVPGVKKSEKAEVSGLQVSMPPPLAPACPVTTVCCRASCAAAPPACCAT